MAGKKIYLGRMIEGLQSDLNQVSKDMQTTADILKTMLDNQGLTMQQAVYAGEDLTNLNPTFVNRWEVTNNNPDVLTNDDGVAKISLAIGHQDEHASIFIPIEREYIIKHSKVSVDLHIGPCNGYVYNLSSATFANFVVYEVVNGSNVPLSGVRIRPQNDFPQDQNEITIHKEFTLNLSDNATGVVIAFGFAPKDLTASAYVGSIDVYFTDNNIKPLESGAIVEDSDVYSITGTGYITFDTITASGAGELASAKIIGIFGEEDDIILLNTSDEVLQDNVGTEIYLGDLGALSFKLKMLMNTGSSLSSINVRYY